MADDNALDFAFVVDTTGSMGGLIAAAQREMIALITRLTQVADVDLRLGLVEYRDHPPQDPLVFRCHAFTSELEQAQRTIMGLKAEGGGDGPESVLDGVLAACHSLHWRSHARRMALLVGDSPPHGVGDGGDAFPAGCPCGETIQSVTAAAEEQRIVVYALGLTRHVADSFGRLSHLTGGGYFSAERSDALIEQVGAILKGEFGQLLLDRQVLAAHWRDPALSLEAVAASVGASRYQVGEALVRLRSRDLLDAPVGTPVA